MLYLQEKFDKKDLQNLPRVVFPGRIVTVLTESEAGRAVSFLLDQPLLGFDTETRPVFRKGVTHPVALLQVATPSLCFLFRLCRTGLTASIVRLLEDRNITKVGLSLKDDFLNLHRLRPFRTGTFIELQQEVRDLGILDQSLQKIYANLFGQKIFKGQQLTNWEADVLTEAQQQYAAIDAWACINIHERIRELKLTQNFRLIPSSPIPTA